MNRQQIYNATFNHFAEGNYWPQSIQYDSQWEFSINPDIVEVFTKGRRDGVICYFEENLKVTPTDKMIQKRIESLPSDNTTFKNR